MALDPIKFVDDDPNKVLADAIADYERISGRTLGAADPEMLLINSFAYRGAIYLNQLNYVGNQNLISFASGLPLEEIVKKLNVFRLDPSAASVVMRFSLVTGAPTLVIEQGTRVKSGDGSAVFAVNEDTTVTSGTSTVDINCTCVTPGEVGNGYTPGLINIIIDPMPYVTGAVNIETSTGGSDDESDDQLRARGPLATATFSVAGPEDAYIYFAKSASPSIVDVSVVCTAAYIRIYPLLAGGVEPGTSELDAVLEICSDKKVRPLNDIVLAIAPTRIDYSITVILAIKKGFNSSQIQEQVQRNLNGFVNRWNNALGRDIKRNQHIGQCMVPGVFDVTLTGLVSDIAISPTQFGYCTGVTVTVGSIVDEP